jgi:hypothetical protein
MAPRPRGLLTHQGGRGARGGPISTYPASAARARGVPPVSVVPFAGGAALADTRVLVPDPPVRL